MNANELADNLERDGEGCTCSAYCAGECACDANWAEYHTKEAATLLRQQAADKDRALRVLKEVDGVLLDYIEQLEKKPMTTLAHGRGVALAVKYMIAVLEEA